ncbi:MAG: polysaccharide deacetylase family protein [Firmicutes bacterium]|nr:polysaccharide deacetylase family protein [Bacillota bacterium]
MIILYIKRNVLRGMGIALLCLILLGCGTMLSPQVAPTAVTGQKPIYAVERSDKTMAISFDASWGAEHTETILAILEQHNVKTTFFLVNLWIEEYPEMVKAIHEKGHEIGLHSATHPKFTELSQSQITKELTANQAAIEKLTGQKPTIFRPPFGDYNSDVIATVSGLGITSVQWSIDSLDWQGLTAQEIADRILKDAAPGAIVLLHNNGDHTAEALELFLPALLNEGYTIIPVGELISENGYTDNNGILHPAE